LAAALPRARLVVLGGRADAQLGQQVSQGAPGRCLDLTGQTTLPEMVEWIRRSELLICNDSGPMHVAAALGKPVVATFGPTDPRRTGPYRQAERVLQSKWLPCVPCFQKRCRFAKPLECLRAISPEQVLAAVLQRLAEGKNPIFNSI
jgi:ADP-heptose:LPS heptosyltransferase